MTEQGKKLGIDLHRVQAVDVSAMPEQELQEQLPCLTDSGFHGTKGLLLSQIKAFREYLASNQTGWLAIFEDDVELPPNFLDAVVRLMIARSDAQVLYLDKRAQFNEQLSLKDKRAPQSCMAAVLYTRATVEKMLPEMEYNRKGSYISIYNGFWTKRDRVRSPKCLHDFFNSNLLDRLKIPVATMGLVDSGAFGTTTITHFGPDVMSVSDKIKVRTGEYLHGLLGPASYQE